MNLLRNVFRAVGVVADVAVPASVHERALLAAEASREQWEPDELWSPPVEPGCEGRCARYECVCAPESSAVSPAADTPSVTVTTSEAIEDALVAGNLTEARDLYKRQTLRELGRPDLIVNRARELRWRYHADEMCGTPLYWSQLTDAQKVPWLLKAADADVRVQDK